MTSFIKSIDQTEYVECSYFSWESDAVNQKYQDQAIIDQQTGVAPECSLAPGYEPFGLAGDDATPDNIDKLNRIADEQTVSEKQQDILDRIGRNYVYPSIELFTMIMADHADKLDWSDELFMEYSIWIGHKFLKHSLAALGEHWGMTRDAVRAVVRRFDRKDSKDDISIPMTIGIVWQAGEIAKCGRLV